jgi:hypothetical protein
MSKHEVVPKHDMPVAENYCFNARVLCKEMNRHSLFVMRTIISLQYELHALAPKSFMAAENDFLWRDEL